MARVKRGIVSKRKHNKLHELTKGFRGSRRKLIKVAKQAALQAGAYAFHGRKRRKRDIRALWITRISEAVKKEGISYSVFMDKLTKAQIKLDRKILSHLVTHDQKTFTTIVSEVKK